MTRRVAKEKMRNYGIVNLVSGGIVLAGFIVYLVCGLVMNRYELIGLSLCYLGVFFCFNAFIVERTLPLHGAFAGGIYGAIINNRTRDEFFYRGKHTEVEILEYENTPLPSRKNAGTVIWGEIVVSILLFVFGILWAIQMHEALIWPWVLVLVVVGVASGVISTVINIKVNKLLGKTW